MADERTPDIVERLRNAERGERTFYGFSDRVGVPSDLGRLISEAADEIERLRASQPTRDDDSTWTCPMRGKVLTCGGRPLQIIPPMDHLVIACTVWECPHTAKPL